jgi:hypothetical protein
MGSSNSLKPRTNSQPTPPTDPTALSSRHGRLAAEQLDDRPLRWIDSAAEYCHDPQRGRRPIADPASRAGSRVHFHARGRITRVDERRRFALEGLVKCLIVQSRVVWW